MEFFKIKRDIPFMRHALVFNAISLITFLAAVFFLFSRGLHLSVEFTGGTLMEVGFSQPVALDPVRARIASLGINDVQVQHFGSARDVLIRMPAAKGTQASEQSQRVMAALKDTDAQAELKRTEFVGPQVGDELAADGLKALAFVVVGIVLYLAFRFEWKFAVAAIIANLHDVVIILGFFALFQWEFSLPVLAAVLAVLGYSVNESVVVFDRVRENFRKMRKATVPEVIDSAITGVISRTIITHAVTLISVIALWIFGTGVIKDIALTMFIGIVTGTDLREAAILGDRPPTDPVGPLAHFDLVALSPDDALFDAMILMVKHALRRIVIRAPLPDQGAAGPRNSGQNLGQRPPAQGDVAVVEQRRHLLPQLPDVVERLLEVAARHGVERLVERLDRAGGVVAGPQGRRPPLVGRAEDGHHPGPDGAGEVHGTRIVRHHGVRLREHTRQGRQVALAREIDQAIDASARARQPRGRAGRRRCRRCWLRRRS